MLTEKDKCIIKFAEAHGDARDLLDIIARQERVIKKCKEQRNEVILDYEKESQANVNKDIWIKWCENFCDKELTDIMEGADEI